MVANSPREEVRELKSFQYELEMYQK